MRGLRGDLDAAAVEMADTAEFRKDGELLIPGDRMTATAALPASGRPPVETVAAHSDPPIPRRELHLALRKPLATHGAAHFPKRPHRFSFLLPYGLPWAGAATLSDP